MPTRFRISNPVSGGQCHLIHLTILLTQFSLYVHKGGLKPHARFDHPDSGSDRYIFTHLKLWVAVARHNFKRVKN